jgi:hypothetical protein
VLSICGKCFCAQMLCVLESKHLMGCMCIQMQLPGGGTMPVRIGLHTGAAADGLVGCANTLQYRCGQ